jgi:hypothetical protein
MVIEWMHEHDVIGIVFHESPHYQLIKRTAPIIRALYRDRRFTPSQLETIWNHASGKHETERATVFTLLAELLDVLSVPDLEYMFGLVQQLDMSSVDSEVVKFVKALASKATIARIESAGVGATAAMPLEPTTDPSEQEPDIDTVVIPSVQILDENSNLVEKIDFVPSTTVIEPVGEDRNP